ncbi:hypothetical protein FJTKL_13509 [Diaporthe vaccinii]|uniref:Uncharacterized protein n=1 Tax=Diaporthe vaccinii TaxID=105482 RepID=A0ABR4EA44_9PEZI
MSLQSLRNMRDVTRGEEESWLFGEPKTLETSSSPISTTINLPRPLRIYLFALHTVVLILIITFFAVNTTDNCPNPGKEQSWCMQVVEFRVLNIDNCTAPVQQSVDYELQTEYANDQTSSVYSGPPSVEQDRAWDKLIRPTFFRTTKEELERAGESFENIAELAEGGYVATLGVYHELHCVVIASLVPLDMTF